MTAHEDTSLMDDARASYRTSMANIFHSSVAAWIVLGASLLLTIAAWLIASVSVHTRAQDNFNYQVDTAVQAIGKRMQEYEQVLRGGVGLLRSSETVSRAQWKEYVSTLLIDTYWPGIQGIGYAQMLTPDEVAAHEATIRAEGFRNYQISPNTERDQYSAIIFLEPFSGRNLRAFGYDMYSEPVRRAAMLRAAQLGQPALSGRVTLVQETEHDIQAGFIVYLPVYRSGAPLTSVEERLAALEGFVYSPFRVNDLMDGILGSGPPIVKFSVYDGDYVDPEQLLYDSSRAYLDTDWSPGEFSALRHVSLQGRNWTISFQSRIDFDEKLHSAQPLIIAISGVIVDILLFAVILSLARNRHQMSVYTQHLAQALGDLHDRESQLERAHKVAKIGSWHLDLLTDQMHCSDQTYQIFGLSPGAPIDQDRFMSMAHSEDRNELDSAWKMGLAGELMDIEFRLASHTTRWVHLRAEFSFDKVHQPVWAQGSVQEITERKRSEQALDLAARVFEHAREGIMITDADVRLVDVNPRFSEITGYQREQVLGRNPSMLSSGQTPTETYTKMWQSLNEFGHWEGELWNRRYTGELYLERISIAVITDQKSDRIINYVGLISDITTLRQQQERMRHAAYHDMLTELPNRYLLNDRLTIAVARAQRRDQSVILAFIDLDGFKPVNDSFGHHVGDQTLIEVAKRLRCNLREEDTVARIGGDEFAVLFADQGDSGRIDDSAERLRDALSRPYQVSERIDISASIGIAVYPKDADSADQLLRAADRAMYAAKQAGQNRVQRVS